MRISTSSLYEQQATAIDNQLATQANYAYQLSTGKKLQNPSDDPTQIGADLALHVALGTTETSNTNVANSTSELTVVDSTLSAATSILQNARTLAIQGASDVLQTGQRTSIASQIDALLSQAVALGNTQYAGKYIFGGTSGATNPPVTTVGSPVSAVKFNGNFQVADQFEVDGEQIPLSTSLKQAFNFASSDGSVDVFQTLINLRNALLGTGNTTLSSNGTTVAGTTLDQSAAQINAAGKTVDPTADIALAVAGNQFATKFVPDAAGGAAFSISSSIGTSIPIVATPGTASLDSPPKAPATVSVVGQINAQTATTGVSAIFDAKTQRITLYSSAPFTVTDVPSGPGAGTTTSNFTHVLGLTQQADLVNNLSRQIGDIDKALSVNLSARAIVGTRINTLGGLKNQFNKSITDNTSTVSRIEDADVPATYSLYSQTQTALQAAYATTSRLEGKTLIDYI